ncbi:hypothetical protein BJX96DRAFT_179748 [Aspergillus floccosus]
MSGTASSAAAGARDAATPVGQQVAHAAHEEDSAAVTAGAEGCADARESGREEMDATPPPSTLHEDTDIDVVWHNLYYNSDFSIMRGWSCGPVERILVDFGKVVEAGVFDEVVSVCASKYMFTVTVATHKSCKELDKYWFAVQTGEWEGEETGQ